MTSDSVESFLELVRKQRLLPSDRLDQLLEKSEVPCENLGKVCETLVDRGLLTPFQATRIRDGRRGELTFAGYPILDDLGPCPGGFALKASHPSLRSPIVLRRIQTEWLKPADNLSAFIQRAQLASTVTHEHLTTILEAGAYEEQLFVVMEPTEGANLESLVRDIGPMPTVLACQYVRQAAMALVATKPSGLSHGDIRPANLSVSPLVQSTRVKADGTPLFRPGPNSSLKVAEFGLVPRRPALLEWIANSTVSPEQLAFVAPERAADGECREPGDVYGLGMSLYYLLTGKTPFVDESASGMVSKIATYQPLPLAAIRPDLPIRLVEFVGHMIARDPAARPTLESVVEQLENYLAPRSPASAPTPQVSPAESSILSDSTPVNLTRAKLLEMAPVAAEIPVAEPLPLTNAVTPSEWAVTPYEGSSGDGDLMFAPAAPQHSDSEEQHTTDFSASPTSTKRRRGMTDSEARQAKKKWLMIAFGLWLLSIPLWIILLYTWGVIGGGTTKDPEPTPIKKRR